ncbi:VOC family protein [Virgibacillus sp. L01]|uniref:VOC family protein n=1 Tax=Virgibacillus sp. L01 TaxID=3457429 RepID=UPI003FD41601
MFTQDITKARCFYDEVLGLNQLMNLEFIVTYGSHKKMDTQLVSFQKGCSGIPVPDLSIEVDDLDSALARVKEAGIPIEYDPAKGPWGLRRFT